MSKKKLPIQDAVIPPIVRSKMDLAYSQIQSEQERKKMKIRPISKLMKRVIAVAACAAVCLCGAYAYYDFSRDKNNDENGVQIAEDETLSNPFTIKVMAAELDRDSALPISVGETASGSWVLNGLEDQSAISYCINFPLSCEGENIKSVTYSVNTGTFQVVEPQDDVYVMDGIAYEGDTTKFGMVGGFYDESMDDEEGVRQVNVFYLKSYTVNYEKQTSDEFWSNICCVREDMEEAFQLIWNSDSPEDEVKALNQLLDGVEITVTANFEDGSSTSETLCLEAGLASIEPWETDDGRTIDTEAQIFVKLI